MMQPQVQRRFPAMAEGFKRVSDHKGRFHLYGATQYYHGWARLDADGSMRGNRERRRDLPHIPDGVPAMRGKESIYDRALRAHLARPLSSLLGSHVNPPERHTRYYRTKSGQLLREDTHEAWKRSQPAPARLKRRQRLAQRRRGNG